MISHPHSRKGRREIPLCNPEAELKLISKPAMDIKDVIRLIMKTEKIVLVLKDEFSPGPV